MPRESMSRSRAAAAVCRGSTRRPRRRSRRRTSCGGSTRPRASSCAASGWPSCKSRSTPSSRSCATSTRSSSRTSLTSSGRCSTTCSARRRSSASPHPRSASWPRWLARWSRTWCSSTTPPRCSSRTSSSRSPQPPATSYSSATEPSLGPARQATGSAASSVSRPRCLAGCSLAACSTPPSPRSAARRRTCRTCSPPSTRRRATPPPPPPPQRRHFAQSSHRIHPAARRFATDASGGVPSPSAQSPRGESGVASSSLTPPPGSVRTFAVTLTQSRQTASCVALLHQTAQRDPLSEGGRGYGTPTRKAPSPRTSSTLPCTQRPLSSSRTSTTASAAGGRHPSAKSLARASSALPISTLERSETRCPVLRRCGRISGDQT
mmetsp:Transcript_25570/g.75032  ORF Transcript_25570/g.75032 Transcript_25570/m.75032 type:complete len:378 (-) Transcript_25570:260-1393(-)